MKQYVEAMHPGGWPRIWLSSRWHWLHRIIDAWWCLTGQHSLHRAWQRGHDQHIMDESARRARGGQ